MQKVYYEFDSIKELITRFGYWSNACGDLHHNGFVDLDESELPDELRRAYTELYAEGNGTYEYLCEFDNKYYVALISEFHKNDAEERRVSMDEFYEFAKKNALALYEQDLFANTVLILGKNTGFDECHEVMFLVPAMEQKSVYDNIEYTIYQNIFGPRDEQLQFREFSSLTELQNDPQLQNMGRYCFERVLLNGEEVFACSTNQQYEDILWGGAYKILNELFSHFHITEPVNTDLCSSVRDLILESLGKDGVKFVDVYDKY